MKEAGFAGTTCSQTECFVSSPESEPGQNVPRGGGEWGSEGPQRPSRQDSGLLTNPQGRGSWADRWQTPHSPPPRSSPESHMALGTHPGGWVWAEGGTVWVGAVTWTKCSRQTWMQQGSTAWGPVLAVPSVKRTRLRRCSDPGQSCTCQGATPAANESRRGCRPGLWVAQALGA